MIGAWNRRNERNRQNVIIRPSPPSSNRGPQGEGDRPPGARHVRERRDHEDCWGDAGCTNMSDHRRVCHHSVLPDWRALPGSGARGARVAWSPPPARCQRCATWRRRHALQPQPAAVGNVCRRGADGARLGRLHIHRDLDHARPVFSAAARARHHPRVQWRQRSRLHDRPASGGAQPSYRRRKRGLTREHLREP